MPQTVFVVFSALALFLPSQPPAPTPTESAYKNQDKAAPEKSKANPDQNSSGPSPSSVNKSTADVAGGDKQQPTRNREHKTTPDWWSIISTALNTIFTGLLVFLMFRQWRAMHRQAEYMRDALEETRKAADAAKSSADVARQALEANIGIVSMVLKTDFISMSNDANLHGSWVEITVTNAGQGSARSLCFEHTVFIEGLSDDFVIRPEPTRTTPTDLPPGVPFVRRSAIIGILFPNAKSISWEYAIGGKNLTVVGSIRYRSIFGEDFRIDYAARPDPSTFIFQGDRLLCFEVVSTLKSDTEG